MVFIFNTIVGVDESDIRLALGVNRKVILMAKNKKDPILVKFAATIRNRRYMLSLTQEQLAARADFHVNYIGGIERAERNPSLTSIYSLAKGLECAAKELLDD